MSGDSDMSRGLWQYRDKKDLWNAITLSYKDSINYWYIQPHEDTYKTNLHNYDNDPILDGYYYEVHINKKYARGKKLTPQHFYKLAKALNIDIFRPKRYDYDCFEICWINEESFNKLVVYAKICGCEMI